MIDQPTEVYRDFRHSFASRREGGEVLEPDTQSFVVKVWLEETVEDEDGAKWRGHVTHVASGERKYLERLSGIATFIMPYLERSGVSFGIFRRLRLFVCRICGW